MFSFKQFTIHQDACAMKVGTDGVLLGVLADTTEATHLLDIGTGTGLVALMLAQRNPSMSIDAIEIDSSAAKQAAENVAQSPWPQIRVHCTALQNYHSNQPFNLIVSNPPYFLNSLKTPLAARTTARHTDSLSFYELVEGVDRLLSPSGKFWVILPAGEQTNFCQLAQAKGLYHYRLIQVHPRADKPAKRVVMGFTRTQTTAQQEHLTIEKEQRHQYTDAFAQLTAPFYLDRD
jgi:tRNA1Val (adenine37-N6)-methyltransferase